MDHARRGEEALSAGRFTDAIAAYTQALRDSPQSPVYFIKRSTAHQRCSPPDYVSALADAEVAVVLAVKRAKRESIAEAQQRRAIALFGLERYGDARFCFDIVKEMKPKEKTLDIWEAKIKSRLEGVDPDDARARVTVQKEPKVDIEKAAKAPVMETSTVVTSVNESGSPKAAPPAQAAPTQTPANKIRNDWYQNTDNVYLTLLAKGVPKDRANIDIQPRSVSISFPTSTGADYEFSLDPLFDTIDPANSNSSVFSTKVEVVLKKGQPGRKWHSLESSEPVTDAGDNTSNENKPTIPQHILGTTKAATGPVYPTSSLSGPKNWDKLASDLTSKKTKNEGDDDKDSKIADDDDYDYDREDGDEVNSFFKKLYSGATPETRRAMMKSFTESNGTALSTNWEEVSKGKVETQPPDGMQAKSWGT